MEYRRLKAGEIIQLGDEYDGCSDPWKDKPKWLPVTEKSPRLGEPAPDPKYPSHTIFRRPINPAESGGKVDQ